MIAYQPLPLPLRDVDWATHVPMIGRAHAALARYDGMLQSIVNPTVLLSPLTNQEAVLSSRIEGTQASLEEVLAFEADGLQAAEPARQADIQEIINYRRAMLYAVEHLQTRPFSLNLLKELHHILLDSVRGRDKSKGNFRRTQNYIAPTGQPIEQATYIPPAWDQVEPAMRNWELYLHADEKDRLVQLAIIKAQFELIHPFLDGNGRLGRMLVPLYLYEHGLLSSPVFYVSAYLETHRAIYYQRLLAISQQGDWNAWIAFFLSALVAQAEANTTQARQILTLYDRMKREVPQLTRSQFAVQAIDALFDRPVFQSSDFVSRSGIPRVSALRILSRLKEGGIIRDLRAGSGRRAAVMFFAELLGITGG